MAKSQTEKAESHERILAVAGQQFRQKGLGGIGIANLMAAAGLTHGGFYCHFKSRAHLVEAAVDRVFQESEQSKGKRTGIGRRRLHSYLDWYLSSDHRDDLAEGCPLAALAADVRHEDTRTRSVFASGLSRYLNWMSALLGQPSKATQSKAALATSAMVGALILSRAMDDSTASEEILDQVRRELRTYLR